MANQRGVVKLSWHLKKKRKGGHVIGQPTMYLSSSSQLRSLQKGRREVDIDAPRRRPGGDVHLHHGGLREGQETVLEGTLSATPLLDRDLKQVALLHALRIARRRVHLGNRARGSGGDG